MMTQEEAAERLKMLAEASLDAAREATAKGEHDNALEHCLDAEASMVGSRALMLNTELGRQLLAKQESRVGDRIRCADCRQVYEHRDGTYGLVCPHCGGGRRVGLCSMVNCRPERHEIGTCGDYNDKN